MNEMKMAQTLKAGFGFPMNPPVRGVSGMEVLTPLDISELLGKWATAGFTTENLQSS
jgi:hypothetical protein